MTDFGAIPLYHHPIKHPVKPNDLFYIAKKIDKQWHIRKSAPIIAQASKARMVFMRLDHQTDKKTTPLDYRIFNKGKNEIIILK